MRNFFKIAILQSSRLKLPVKRMQRKGQCHVFPRLLANRKGKWAFEIRDLADTTEPSDLAHYQWDILPFSACWCDEKWSIQYQLSQFLAKTHYLNLTKVLDSTSILQESQGREEPAKRCRIRYRLGTTFRSSSLTCQGHFVQCQQFLQKPALLGLH
jgi:hypothetical protein